MSNVWDRLEGCKPIDRVAKAVARHQHADDRPLDLRARIAELEAENLRLEQENIYLMESKLHLVGLLVNALLELRRRAA